MVSSHAKHNTTQSTLTHYERSLLKKEGAARRLGADSMKPIDSCNLCLSTVTSPVACSSGHLYCRECAVSNLITQKAAIEAQRAEMDRWEASEARERDDARARARDRVLADFEKGMSLGLAPARKLAVGRDENRVGKFEQNRPSMEQLTKEAEDRALRTLEAEQTEARKHKLAAFWLPDLAPEAKFGPLKDVKLQPLCHIGGTAHPFSYVHRLPQLPPLMSRRKSLLPVILTYPSGTSTKKTPMCPSCTREITNAAPAFLLSSRSPAKPANGDEANGEDGPKKKKAKKEREEPLVCGHVICKTCVDTIVIPSGRCCVCEAAVEGKGRIPLGKEGTGYAAAGGAEVKKSVTTFRI